MWVKSQTWAKTRSSGSQFHLFPTVAWGKKESKKGSEERKQIGSGKFVLVKIILVSVP